MSQVITKYLQVNSLLNPFDIHLITLLITLTPSGLLTPTCIMNNSLFNPNLDNPNDHGTPVTLYTGATLDYISNIYIFYKSSDVRSRIKILLNLVFVA